MKTQQNNCACNGRWCTQCAEQRRSKPVILNAQCDRDGITLIRADGSTQLEVTFDPGERWFIPVELSVRDDWESYKIKPACVIA